ncbi:MULTISPECIES: hypothetical protein [unclassified Rhodococcus (in: high G+C Gram-positive bacteria)]|uniref:hypothetical protein n=1 Tax=Rhodococcus sp. SJ-3 TaxID=3454628 RepID=UPI003F78D5E2
MADSQQEIKDVPSSIASPPHGERQPERQRLRKLAQAALNADMTVDQLQTIIGDLDRTLGNMDHTISGLDGAIAGLGVTLARFDRTLDQVDATVSQMSDVVGRLERVTGRLESLVDIAEIAVRPLGALEWAGRSIAVRLGWGDRSESTDRRETAISE